MCGQRLVHVFTFPQERNKGCARLLVEYVANLYSPLYLWCTPDKESFYKSFGFEHDTTLYNHGQYQKFIITVKSKDECPITLVSRADITNVFEVLDKSNKVVKIYDLIALSDWLTLKPFYPHNRQNPSNDDIAKLSIANIALNRRFVYANDRVSFPNYYNVVVASYDNFNLINVKDSKP